jgi:aspartate oxidase
MWGTGVSYQGAESAERAGTGFAGREGERGAAAVSRAVLAAAMSRYAGVVRDREGLTELLRVAAARPGRTSGGFAEAVMARAGSGWAPGYVQRLAEPADGDPRAADTTGGLRRAELGRVRENELPAPVVSHDESGLDLAMTEAANLRAVSVLIASAARERTESRGCHRRRDAPRT